jgi:HEAT repeat protein
MVPSMRFCLAAFFLAVLAGPLPAADPALVQKSWDILEAGVNEKSFGKRHDAIHAVGLLVGDSKAVAITEKALDDPAPEVREAAATSLGELHSSASIPKLELALKDKDITVVLAAAHALWQLQDKQAFEIYYEILLGERKAGPGLIAGQEAMFRDHKKLATFAFEQGIEFNPFAGLGWGIIKTVHQDDVSPVRAAAALILVDDPDPRSSQALVKTCSDKNWIVRVAALDALARRGDASVIKDLVADTADEKDRVRYTAAAAIIRLSSVPEGPKAEKAGAP